MAENVTGEIKVKLITETGGPDEEKAAGKQAAPAKPAEKEDSRKLTGMEKWLSIVGKAMKKAVPVFDVSNIIVSIIKKSQVLMSLIEAFFDIVGGFIDILLAPLIPLLTPILRILASFLPIVQVLLEALNPILEPITDVLNKIAGWVSSIATFFKSTAPANMREDAIAAGKPGWLQGIAGFLDKMPMMGAVHRWEENRLQSGTSFVPHTMTAELHRGEAVLSARENKSGAGSSGISINNPQFTINAGGSTTMDAKAFAQQLYREFTKKLTEETRRA